MTFLEWLQATGVAVTIGQSAELTGLLSAIHLVGLTLIVGGALVSGLRLLGIVLAEYPIPGVTGAPVRGTTLGLVISITTGFLLFSARATEIAEKSTFQVKMGLLVAAALFHFLAYRRFTRKADPGLTARLVNGSAAIALWFGVALAGCAFILFE